VKGLDGRVLEGAVHAFGLPVGPWAIRFCQLVANAAFIADPAKDVHAQKGIDRFVSILGQVSKGYVDGR